MTATLPTARDVDSAVVDLKNKHSQTWRDKPESYWLGRSMQEMSEIALALTGNGEHSDAPAHDVDLEITQLASILLNWLEMRADAARRESETKDELL